MEGIIELYNHNFKSIYNDSFRPIYKVLFNEDSKNNTYGNKSNCAIICLDIPHITLDVPVSIDIYERMVIHDPSIMFIGLQSQYDYNRDKEYIKYVLSRINDSYIRYKKRIVKYGANGGLFPKSIILAGLSRLRPETCKDLMTAVQELSKTFHFDEERDWPFVMIMTPAQIKNSADIPIYESIKIEK